MNENSNQLEIQFIHISVCLGCLVSHMTLSALIKNDDRSLSHSKARAELAECKRDTS